MVLSPVFIISRVINSFISVGHKGCISMIKLSEITIEVRKNNSLLFCLLCSIIHVSIILSMKSSVFWDMTSFSLLTFNGLHGIISQEMEPQILQCIPVFLIPQNVEMEPLRSKVTIPSLIHTTCCNTGP
jgi:hypothetical protein